MVWLIPALIATTALQAVGQIQAGQAQRKAYEAEAKQAELEARQSAVERMRELNRALALQAVEGGASGRAFEGSMQLIQKEDIKKGQQDIDLIRATGQARAESARLAGKQAQTASLFQAAGTIGSGATQYGQLKK